MKLVAGCMRSGTSFVCNLLEKLGGNLGNVQDHVQSDQWNSKGYYETRDVNLLNNELLFGDWGDPDIWVDQMWPDDMSIVWRKRLTIALSPLICRPVQIEKRGQAHSREIREICERFQDVIIKDPRFSFVMKEWETHGDVERVLYCFRHPWEASYSMSRQTGFPVFLTYSGWNDAIERFWAQTHETPIIMANYNAFFDWETAQEEFKGLFAFLDKDYNASLAKEVFDSVYDPKMRSSVATDIRLPSKTSRLYQELLDKPRFL